MSMDSEKSEKNIFFQLQNLLKTAEQDRNFSWDEKFFKIFSESTVTLLSSDPQQGPDGWPYLICKTDPDSENLSTESAQKLFHWLAQKGIGLVVNPQRSPYPDYVFSYGMIWFFRETGYFLRPDLAFNSGSNTQADFQNKNIFSGAPTESFLPLYVRKVLKDFLRDQMILKPRVLMISSDQKNYDLCFSLESLGNPPESEHAGVAEALAWFLPTHYSIVLISEQGLPAFYDL